MPLLDGDDDGEDLAKIVEDELLRDPDADDPDKPRDPIWLRLAKFAAIVVASAVVIGVIFALGDYLVQHTGHTFRDRELARNVVDHDSEQYFYGRFLIGACVGAGCSLIYVARCLIKGVDP